MRELAAHSPTRSRGVILVEVEDWSEADVLGVLAAVETCLSANEIRSVRIAAATATPSLTGTAVKSDAQKPGCAVQVP